MYILDLAVVGFGKGDEKQLRELLLSKETIVEKNLNKDILIKKKDKNVIKKNMLGACNEKI